MSNIKDGVEVNFEVKVVFSEMTGNISREFWYLNKMLESPGDRPAVIHYDEQGNPTSMCWMHKNSYHRENGPARLEIVPETGVIYLEQWMKHGTTHRDGEEPAVIIRDKQSGEICNTVRYLNGVKQPKTRKGSVSAIDPKPEI